MTSWWDWADPQFTLSFVAAITGAFIPFLILLLSHKGQRLAQRALEAQRVALEDQRMILTIQRREELEKRLETTNDSTVLDLLRHEVERYTGVERRLLERALRSNPVEPLPHIPTSSPTEIADFVASLASRIANSGHCQLQEIKNFVTHLPVEIGKRHSYELSSVLVSDAMALCGPSHQYYREIVSRGAWYLAPDLIVRTRHVSTQRSGFKLNVITGVLIALKDFNLGRVTVPAEATGDAYRENLQSVLAGLLHDGLPCSGGLEARTEPMSATVAWLIRAVGVNAGLDAHLDMRCVEGLADAVRMIVPEDSGWAADEDDVRTGLAAIAEKLPQLWASWGAELEEITGVSVSPVESSTPRR